MKLSTLNIIQKLTLNKIERVEKMNINSYEKTIILNKLNKEYDRISDEIFELKIIGGDL